MELAQTRIVTDDVEGMARFYAELVGVAATLNEFYVELAAGPVTVGFSKCQFTDYRQGGTSCGNGRAASQGEMILDFAVDDVDGEYERLKGIVVEWVTRPTTQPWGKRSMSFRDPEGHLVNLFSRS
jgi:predicted enzyme related to lactoylglutathione lyase